MPALSSSSRASSSSSSVRGAAIALPVQLEISAVRKLFPSPRGRKSLIVADVIGTLRYGRADLRAGLERARESMDRERSGRQVQREGRRARLAYPKPLPSND